MASIAFWLRLVALHCLIIFACLNHINALHIVLAGGTGPVGALVASQLDQHSVTILTRNSFLASSPSRVSGDFGWLGASYLQKNPHVKLRDWDGGDLLDIVGRDWIGWQDDVTPADCVVHLTGGGFTEQRVMACERLVRETYDANRLHHITVNPTDRVLSILFSMIPEVKKARIQQCEEMVQANCIRSTCLRSDSKLAKGVAEAIVGEIQKLRVEAS